jgi:hypothetical protein
MSNRITVVAVDVDDEYAADVLTTAVEQGSGYWAIFDLVQEGLKTAEDSIGYWTRVEGRDRETGKRFVVDLAKIKAAIPELLAGDHVADRIKATILADNNDAESSDCIFQMAALGAVIYG